MAYDAHSASLLLPRFTPSGGTKAGEYSRIIQVPEALNRPPEILRDHLFQLYTCHGTPMLWQGQEFADNYVLPDSGDLRVHFRRNVHWEYFYDAGAPLVRSTASSGSSGTPAPPCAVESRSTTTPTRDRWTA